jgi:hypothetical protein
VTDRPAKGAAGAGALLISSILFCAGIGLGLGALFGAPAPFALGAGGVGVVLGFYLVYGRFKDI